jgi:alkylation response protein AidB-like acyl-CoA dehydrogenase
MSELRALLANTTEKVLSNLSEDDDAAFNAARDAGLLEVMRPERDGGFGGGWEDAFIVLRATGYHAAPPALGIAIGAHGGRSPNDEMAACALVRACQMAGAMQGALDLSVGYVRERVQFGKSLSTLQAIQQQLALLAEETAATSMAAVAACRAADRGGAQFEIAAAKLRANTAVGTVTSVAHQVHGAMGFTKDYKLQKLTKLLWQWRSEYGNDRWWADKLGAAMAKQGADGFWPALVAPATIAPSGSG